MSTIVDETRGPSREMLPEPDKRARRYTIISADDHVVEPQHLFEGRMPAKYAERTPRVVTTDEGHEAWLFDGYLLSNIGLNAVAGRKRVDDTRDPISFAEMRPSAWQIDARVADMDLDGVYASLCFPSFLAGFGGVRLQTTTDDQEFALALVRAWNDWHLDEWAGAHPGRIIPLQLPWLHDPELAAAEIRRNAERGFTAVTFPESPHQAGFRSLHSGYWDPFVAACAETGTVICVHTGSAGKLPETAVDAPRDVTSALFGAGYSLTTAVDWLYSRYAVKHPDIKIVISEGGIGWVPALLDRLRHSDRKQGDLRGLWTASDLKPDELLLRNFWFCLVDEPLAMVQRHHIGIENILFETDFPHADSPWPDSQALLHEHLADLPDDDARRISWQNASELFRHPVPEAVQRDPEAF
jgi:predicted TIM-barrel fold metal-dependent hydrolase